MNEKAAPLTLDREAVQNIGQLMCDVAVGVRKKLSVNQGDQENLWTPLNRYLQNTLAAAKEESLQPDDSVTTDSFIDGLKKRIKNDCAVLNHCTLADGSDVTHLAARRFALAAIASQAAIIVVQKGLVDDMEHIDHEALANRAIHEVQRESSKAYHYARYSGIEDKAIREDTWFDSPPKQTDVSLLIPATPLSTAESIQMEEKKLAKQLWGLTP